MRHLFPPLVAIAAMLTATPTILRAQAVPDAQRIEFEKIIKDYLLKHPEVIQEAITEFEKKRVAIDVEKRSAVVKLNAQSLFNSTHQVTLGNVQGDVTLVEFFDYNCGYCKRALADLLALLKEEPKLRVVLKEFPVLGKGSVEAASVAVAVRMQDKSGTKYLDFHQRLLSHRGPVDKTVALAAAKDAGLDLVELEKSMTSSEVGATIEETTKLAQQLGIRGTPSYVVGNDVVVGAVGGAALRQKIQTARR